jgi:hypothetical protein
VERWGRIKRRIRREGRGREWREEEEEGKRERRRKKRGETYLREWVFDRSSEQGPALIQSLNWGNNGYSFSATLRYLHLQVNTFSLFFMAFVFSLYHWASSKYSPATALKASRDQP